MSFQSSPGPKAGRCVVDAPDGVARHSVSILARPEGRALRGRCTRWCGATFCFNPRPARRPGAAWMPGGSMAPGPASFNPRPARRPGAARPPAPACSGRSQRFNPRPARRPGAAGAWRGVCTVDVEVSILARPEGRALLGKAVRRMSARIKRFNPRPARRPGAAQREALHGEVVRAGFNPRPARRPGAAGRRPTFCRRPASFNPRPARRPGAAWRSTARSSPRSTRFNPRPARRPGAACSAPGQQGAPMSVSILARPEGRALPR